MMPGRFFLLLSLLGTLPLRAQEIKQSGLYLTTPLGLSYGKERNLPVGSRLIDDSVFLFQPPKFSLIGKSPRTDFLLDYDPEFEIFDRQRELNAWNHAASLRYSHKMARRLTLEMGDSFLASEDASRQQREGFFLLPRGRFQQNAGYLGVNYRLNPRTALSLRADSAVTKVRLPENPRSDSMDQLSTAATLSLTRELSRNHRLSGTYSLVKFKTLGSDGESAAHPPGSSGPLHSVNLVYDYTLTPHFSFELSGGAIRGTLNSYSASTRTEWRSRALRIATGYQRQISVFGGIRPGAGGLDPLPGFATGLLANSLADALTLSFRGNIGKWVGIEGSGEGSRTRSGALRRDIKSIAGRLRLDVRLTGRLIAFSDVGVYRQNLNALIGAPLERTRYSGGLEIVLSKDRIRRDSPPGIAGRAEGKSQ